ncbi:MAG: hypothetical protein FWH56_10215, partial [Betaproteobacteria bacterium]|nr:hypothetical protein [Betaproteobacteria bacterium]
MAKKRNFIVREQRQGAATRCFFVFMNKNISPASSRASGLFSKPCLILFCVLFPLYTPTLAQIIPPPQTVPPPGDQNLIQERQQKLLEDQQRRLEELKRLPSEPAAPAP